MTDAGNLVSATLQADGRISVPKAVLKQLGVGDGGSVMFVIDGDAVRVVNPLRFALERIQEKLDGVAEATGLTSEEAIMKAVKEVRTSAR